MSFNIGHALLSAAETFATTGNPVAAGVSGIAGGLEQSAPAQPSFDPNTFLSAIEGQPQAQQRVNALSNLAQDFSIIGGN